VPGLFASKLKFLLAAYLVGANLQEREGVDMRALSTPLSQREVTALIQIRLQARLEPKHRGTASRLIHLGLVDETARGFHVTPAGELRCMEEARHRGLVQP
jgi:hypothetical protein